MRHVEKQKSLFYKELFLSLVMMINPQESTEGILKQVENSLMQFPKDMCQNPLPKVV